MFINYFYNSCRGVWPPRFSSRLIREGAFTVALLLFSTAINTALPPMLLPPPSASFSNFLSPVPGFSLGPIYAPLDPSHPGSLDPPLGRSASPQLRTAALAAVAVVKLQPRLAWGAKSVCWWLQFWIFVTALQSKGGYTSTVGVPNALCSRTPSLHTTVSTILSQPLDLSLPSSCPSSPYLLFCILVVVGADMHDPSTVAILLAKRLGDCDGEGLRGHACDYTTRPMAEMPRSDGSRFCLAALLVVVQVTPCRLSSLVKEAELGGEGRRSIVKG
jgi:hypothetical protein